MRPPPLDDRLLTATEAAELLGVKVATIRQWTYQRRLPVVRLGRGRAVRYRLTTLQGLIQRWEEIPRPRDDPGIAKV